MDFVAKLKNIMRIDGIKAVILIELQWYFRKIDIPQDKYSKYIPCISDNEVFLTDQKDV